MKRSIRISDHALLRWIERVGRFDLNIVRDAILAGTRSALDAGARRCTNRDGLTYALDPRTRTVVTVMDDTEPNAMRMKKRSPRDFREPDEA